MTLLAPDGTTVYTARVPCRSIGPRPPAAVASGTYTLQIDGVGDDTPNYQLKLWDVPAPDVTSIDIGDVVNGQIETPGVVDGWQFTAAANQSIFIDFQQYAGGYSDVNLLAPDGTTVYTEREFNANRLDQGPVLLAQDGTYTLHVVAWAMTRPPIN